MMIFYDTLLADGEYRLGVRYANPYDVVLSPPFAGDEARLVVSTQYAAQDDTVIEIGLPPLTQVGARIIVPYLSEEAVDALRSGEFHEWLTRCWWRAIQIGELTIDVVDEHGTSTSISTSSWWEGEPWSNNQDSTGPNVKIHENINVGQGLTIKRIVLLYDENLDVPDIEDVSSQFWGVQLLRGRQWIETLGTQEVLSDYIPRDKRPEFRGFVEFERRLERVLRDVESSQHDRFDGRNPNVKAVRRIVQDKVREFAEAQGWTSQESTRPAPGTEKDAAMEFLRFLAPGGRSNKAINGSVPESGSQLTLEPVDRWECELSLDFPHPKTTRVNWGNCINNVAVKVSLLPTKSQRRVKVSLTLTKADTKASTEIIETQELEILDGKGVAEFGHFQIITGAHRTGKIQCTEPGKWKLGARVKSAGATVAQASR